MSLPRGDARPQSDSNQRVNRLQSIRSPGGLYAQRLGRLTPAALDRMDSSQLGDLGLHIGLSVGGVPQDRVEGVVQLLVVGMPL